MNSCCCCCCVQLSTGTHLGPHHEPVGSESDGDEYESLATLLSFLSSRTRTATGCDVLMYEIGGSEGENNPARVKRTRRVFPHLTCKASSACAEMFWCGELVRVRSRAIAVVDYFAITFVQKQSAKFGFYAINRVVVDSILPAWFCGPKIHLVFGFGLYAITRAKSWPYKRWPFT